MKKVSVLEERGRPTSGEEATAGRNVTRGHGLSLREKVDISEGCEISCLRVSISLDKTPKV